MSTQEQEPVRFHLVQNSIQKQFDCRTEKGKHSTPFFATTFDKTPSPAFLNNHWLLDCVIAFLCCLELLLEHPSQDLRSHAASETHSDLEAEPWTISWA